MKFGKTKKSTRDTGKNDTPLSIISMRIPNGRERVARVGQHLSGEGEDGNTEDGFVTRCQE